MTTEIDRIKFIQSIEGFQKINAYLDLPALNRIKKLMHEAGLYQVDLHEIKDSSIMNLLLKAQGKKAIRNMKTKTTYKDSRKKVIDL